MSDTIQKLNSIHREILCKRISCNVEADIKAYEAEVTPLRDALVSKLKAAGYVVTLNNEFEFMNGHSAVLIERASIYEKLCSFINNLTHQTDCKRRYKTCDPCGCGLDEMRQLVRDGAQV